MSGNNCENCKFGKEFTQYHGAGKCHRFPPTLRPNEPDQRGYIGTTYDFTPITKSDWCGEWKDMEER